MHVVYTGERVRLRPFSSADEWGQLRDEIDAVPNEYWGLLYHPRGRHAADFEETGLLKADGLSAFAIERLDTNQLVGYERHRTPPAGGLVASVGTLILDGHWHRGFGIEAKQLCFCYLFENYPVERVEASTFNHHPRARRGMERSGMHMDGRLRSLHRVGGVAYDMLTYCIFREQWEQLPIRQVVKRGAL